MADTADVIVVGGGVNGASIAWALASQGVGRVVLCEKGALASGASGRSSALVRMHYTNETDARLAFASFPIFRHWTELMGGGPSVFTHPGFVNVVGPPYAAALPRDRARAPRARQGDRHRRGHAPGGARAAARDFHRQRSGELFQTGERDPHDRRRAVPGLGPRPRRAAVPPGRGAGGGRPDPDPSHPGDGGGDTRAR